MQNFDIRKDGRFVVVIPDSLTGPVGAWSAAAAQTNVVLNWLEELKPRAPACH